MFKKITFLLLISSTFFVYGQTTIINDFEAGSPTIRTQFGATYSALTNPDATGDNTSANIGRCGRTTGLWYELINFKLATSFIIPANETRYLHVLVKANNQIDMPIRYNGVDGTFGQQNGTGALRPTNDYTDIGEWQDMVYAIPGGGSGTTVNYITLFPDAGFNNIPSGQFLNNTDEFLFVDNFKFTNSAASELQNTWLGTTATWSTPSNWSRGLPSSSLGVIIPTGVTEPVVADGTAIETNYLNIDAGTSINISNGSSLIVHKESTTNNNSIKYSRTLTANADATKAWHLTTSPIAGVSIVNFIAGNTLASGTTNTNFRGIANYKNDGSSFNYYLSDYSGTDAFNVGKGFAIKNATAGNVTFSGFFRKSDREFTISQGTNNFNLAGNPYLAYINLGTFLTENNAVANRLSEATIWLWDPNKNGAGNGGYVTKMLGTDASFEIAPGQAFFVSSGSAASNKITFSESNQSHKTDSFLKSSANRTEINVLVSQDNLISSTKLYYTEEASTGFDNGYDASMFTGVNYDLAIYSNLVSGDNQRKIETQSLPNKDYNNMIIPIGIKATKAKEITISATSLNLPDGITIYLEDKQNNTLTNLNTTDYKITLKENLNGSGRFFLKTTTNVLSLDDTELSNINIYNSGNNNIRVTGLEESKDGVISVFNILGEQVLTHKFSSRNNLNITLPNLTKGIYIVKLDTKDKILNKKIILD
jgi:hypothetical protein